MCGRRVHSIEQSVYIYWTYRGNDNIHSNELGFECNHSATIKWTRYSCGNYFYFLMNLVYFINCWASWCSSCCIAITHLSNKYWSMKCMTHIIRSVRRWIRKQFNLHMEYQQRWNEHYRGCVQCNHHDGCSLRSRNGYRIFDSVQYCHST